MDMADLNDAALVMGREAFTPNTHLRFDPRLPAARSQGPRSSGSIAPAAERPALFTSAPVPHQLTGRSRDAYS